MKIYREKDVGSNAFFFIFHVVTGVVDTSGAEKDQKFVLFSRKNNQEGWMESLNAKNH